MGEVQRIPQVVPGAPLLLTLDQVAAALGCSRRIVTRLVKSGRLPTIELARNKIRVLASDIAALARTRRR